MPQVRIIAKNFMDLVAALPAFKLDKLYDSVFVCEAIMSFGISLGKYISISEDKGADSTYVKVDALWNDINICQLLVITSLQQNAHPRVATRVPAVPGNVTDQIRFVGG